MHPLHLKPMGMDELHLPQKTHMTTSELNSRVSLIQTLKFVLEKLCIKLLLKATLNTSICRQLIKLKRCNRCRCRQMHAYLLPLHICNVNSCVRVFNQNDFSQNIICVHVADVSFLVRLCLMNCFVFKKPSYVDSLLVTR